MKRNAVFVVKLFSGKSLSGPRRVQQVVVDIDGDGSFLMNCQEMATAAIEKMDIKMFILNNQHLGMVVQWEDRFYKVCMHPPPGIMCSYKVTCQWRCAIYSVLKGSSRSCSVPLLGFLVFDRALGQLSAVLLLRGGGVLSSSLTLPHMSPSQFSSCAG